MKVVLFILLSFCFVACGVKGDLKRPAQIQQEQQKRAAVKPDGSF